MKHKEIEFTKEELDNEIWKDIPNYKGLYEASNLGRIRTSANKTTYTELHGIRHWKQRILKYKTNNENTYKTGFRVDLWKNGKSKDYLVCRLVASTFIENNLYDRSLTVNHIDGNRLDNRIQNLEWCSLRENIQKGFETGLYDSISIKIKLTNKNTQESTIYNSQIKASLALGHNSGYLSNSINRNKFENKDYRWEIINE